MTLDRRLLPGNGRTALLSLRGQVAAETFVAGEPASMTRPLTPLWREPGGGMDTQLHFGAPVTVIERGTGHSFVQCAADGYVGYVDSAALGARTAPSHRVTARATMAHERPDMKSPVRDMLSFGALVAGGACENRFLACEPGWIPAPHLTPLTETVADWVALAEGFLGTPYLWGGAGGWGIDCSGLVQAALWAAGRDCPRDSDQQCAALGAQIDPRDGLRRGDLVFWRGHVGIMTDRTSLLHANAHHMAVVREPLQRAIARIDAQGSGKVIATRRP